jgi:hypothetical protein
VAFLVDEVGVPREKLAKIFSTFPQLFGLSLDKVRSTSSPGTKISKFRY